MDLNDKAVAYGTAIIPPWLAHRYRQDPVFHHLVDVLVRIMGEADVVAADVREASVVAAEMIREKKIQEAIHELPDPVITVPGRGTYEPHRSGQLDDSEGRSR